MCGWEKPPTIMPLKLSVPTGDPSRFGNATHFDPGNPHQRKKIVGFYKRCPGSGRGGIAVTTKTLQCVVCMDIVKATSKYKTSRHLPVGDFLKEMETVLNGKGA